MTNPTATERARVARASGRSGFRRSININRVLAPIDLLIDTMAFLLSPLGWALKEMRQRIGALLARKLAAQLRRTLAHAGIPIPELCDVELIFWVSRTKPLLRDQTPSPTGKKPKGMSGACGDRYDSISNTPSALTPVQQFASEGVTHRRVSDHPNTDHFHSLVVSDGTNTLRFRARGPPAPMLKPNPKTALAPRQARPLAQRQKLIVRRTLRDYIFG
jgi:hypothetical protein